MNEADVTKTHAAKIDALKAGRFADPQRRADRCGPEVRRRRD